MMKARGPTKKLTCPNCPIGLQVERAEAGGWWMGCPKCGHVEWVEDDAPPADPSKPGSSTPAGDAGR